MKILENTIPLHKLYGFLLLNTSLVVFTPTLIGILKASRYSNGAPPEMILSMALAFCGLILSILFILGKKIAIHLLTILLVASIFILSIYMFYTLSETSHIDIEAALLILNVFGFFILEGVLGLLIIHSKKLSDEFESYK